MRTSVLICHLSLTLGLVAACSGGSDGEGPDPHNLAGRDGSLGGAGASAGEGGSGTAASIDSGTNPVATGDGGGVVEAADGGGSGDGGAQDAGSQAPVCKRGVAYGHHSKADLAALQPAVAWWYNWAYTPDQDLDDGSYLALGVEYAPMIWGGSFNVAAAIANIPEDARVLLGFNEPNFGSQANMSATQAAARWPDVESIADALGLLLVSPAVNYCGGDCQDTNPFDYLDDFLAACDGCRVDRVAFHIYVGCNASGSNKAQWLIDHVENYKQRFSQPLWLTEFACTDAKNFDEQVAFMRDAVAYLESESRIERYAWFSGRFDGIPFVDLLGNDGERTPLGDAYVEAPANPECAR